MALPISTVRRIDFGYFVRPAEETGTGKPRVEALLGYAIVNEAGVLLFDTGLGEGDPEADAWYRPARRPLPALGTLTDEQWQAANDAVPGLKDYRRSPRVQPGDG
jgi:hypothetical protein